MDIKMTSFKKDPIKVLIKENEKELWVKFHPHHYMTANSPLKDSLPKGAKFYTFYWVLEDEEILIGCAGILFQINKNTPSKRLTRVVVLPEYQGLGFGSIIVNSLGEFYTDEGFRIYSATFHPRLGEYRENSPLWEATHYNLREFRTSDIADSATATMNNTRAGVSMYRHSYKKAKNYELMYNPIELDKLRRETYLMEKELKAENAKAYREKALELKRMLALTEEKYEIKELKDMTDEEHEKSKSEHKNLFKKPKRKVLSKEERRALKEKKKINKENTKDDEW